ncbi:MAG TPA: PKD domain-containing protein [Candidatus Sulfotelmatobacter sp.]|jgi:hypothetical protein|nr:PKD domain-containing protein [Candidatus Sulfotelmatobacter sp.]
MRRHAQRVIILILALGGLLLAPGLIRAHAIPVYVPGVKPGDTALYAQAFGSWNLTGPPQPPFSQFINLNFTTLKVSGVTGTNVTAHQTFTYTNKTTRADTIFGSVATDSGNITFWFIAANLTQGQPIYTTSNAPVINQTDTESYAGAQRQINTFTSQQNPPGGPFSSIIAKWDQRTGLLVEVQFDVLVGTQGGPVHTASLHARLIQTSLWNPNPPQRDFTANPILTSIAVHQGHSRNDSIILTSLNGFTGNITITTWSFCAIGGGCLTAVVNPSRVFLAANSINEAASLNVTASSTLALGVYSVTVQAQSGTIQHTATVTVSVVGSQTTTTLSNDPNSPDWMVLSPTWSLRNGNLDGSGLSGSLSPKIISTAAFSSDRTVQVKFKTVAQGAQSWYVAWIAGKYLSEYDRTVVLLHTDGTLELSIGQQQPSGEVLNIYTKPTNLSDTTWHTARLVYSGNNIQVFLDGLRYLNVNDTIVGALGACKVELASWGNSESQFSNTTVTGSVLADEPPVANFFLSPQPAKTGEVVSFNGSPSTDPDGFINSYSWSFGDGTVGFGEFPSHVYNSPGNYTVTLQIIDSSGLTATISHQVTVVQPLTHDVGIVVVDPEPKTAISGQTINVGIELVNLGQQAETVEVSAYYNSHVAATIHGVYVQVTSGNFPIFVSVPWDTSGVASGNYTISATVFLSTDQNPANNHLTDGQVTILPPPVLSATPSSGSLGDKVSVHGSGFPVSTFPGQPFSSPVTIEVTFDDQLLGFTTTSDGTFTFVFDVPHAQVGSHQIHAYAELYPSPLEATLNFTVTPQPSQPIVTIGVGTIYFPGDTATIYVLATSNGIPAQTATVHLTLVLPNGTSINMSLHSIAPGVYKASYNVPATGSTGTYGLIANAQMNGLNTSGLASFEVKPSWLQTNGRTVLTASSIAGTVGILGVLAAAWRKGYLTRRRDEFPIP